MRFNEENGGWYIENSLTTLGQKDPVSEYNSQLWNNGTDAGKELARKQKRKLTYISNIYVVKDPANPENEGKTFLFKYGKKILINSLQQCNLSSRMKKQSIHSISGRVLTLN